MNKRMAFLVALIVLLPLATCEQTLKSVKPGPVTLDLGDGYTASFTLGNTEQKYDIEISTPSINQMIPEYKHYAFYIYPTGSEDQLGYVSMTVSSKGPMSSPLPVDRREEDTGDGNFGLGARVVIAKTIDGSIGYVGYDWQTGKPVTDEKDAISAFFHYYPGARKTSSGIEGNVDVIGEPGILDKFPRSLPIFQALIDTLKIRGPAIP
jgi:hypothetical protein